MCALDERYKLALETVGKINEAGSQRIQEALGEIAPEFHRLIMSFAYGDINSRPQLDLKSREIATIAALTAMANARPQLEAHIIGGLNTGLTKEQIVEIIMQMAVYAGVPASLNGMMAARKAFQVFDDQKKS
jgi:4-carboxymuconolactone decarboxylase